MHGHCYAHISVFCASRTSAQTYTHAQTHTHTRNAGAAIT